MFPRHFPKHTPGNTPDISRKTMDMSAAISEIVRKVHGNMSEHLPSPPCSIYRHLFWFSEPNCSASAYVQSWLLVKIISAFFGLSTPPDPRYSPALEKFSTNIVSIQSWYNSYIRYKTWLRDVICFLPTFSRGSENVARWIKELPDAKEWKLARARIKGFLRISSYLFRGPYDFLYFMSS